MAIYHLHVSIISRSKGRSAVASAAWRSGERLKDQYYGLTRDYTRDKDFVAKRLRHSYILAPAGAPAWAIDRQQLWNQVEQREHRADSQLASQFDIALPNCLTPDQQRAC